MVRSPASDVPADVARRSLVADMPLDIPPDDVAVVRAADRTVTRLIAGETLIVPIAAGTADLDAIFTLNPVASRIWELIEQPRTVPQLVDAVCDEFEVPRESAARDVVEFLDSLRGAGLIATADGRG